MDSDTSKLNDIDFNVRYKALDDVFDETTLIEVATDDVDDYIRYKAYNRLRIYHPDSFYLFDPYFVSKCRDELLLTFIVKDSMYNSPKLVCGQAISKDILVPYLVLYDRRWEIRALAVSNPNLSDENLLMDVVLYDYHNGVRKAAIENPNLKIQSLFELMARHDSDDGIRRVATKRLDGEEILTDLALNDSKWYVRCAAVENPHLDDEEVMIKAAVNDPVDYVRLCAIDKTTDENVLARIAVEDKVRKVRRKAIKRLKKLNPKSIYLIEKSDVDFVCDKKEILEIARNAISLDSRKAAIAKIEDNDILADFAKNDSKWRVRQVAAENPHLHSDLASIALKDSSPRVRKAAFMNQNFNDESVLAQISRSDSNETNRYYAINKLNRLKDNHE